MVAITDIIKFANNVEVRLAASINDSQTIIDLEAGAGAQLPELGVGEFHKLTFVNIITRVREVVNVTARIVDQITVERAQEGTDPTAFSVLTTNCQINPTAGTMDRFIQKLFDGASVNQFLRVTAAGFALPGSILAADIPPLDASIIQSGIIDTARLGSGTADVTTYLNGLSQWTVVPPSAPLAGQYVVLASDSTLPNERILTQGANISITDGGPGLGVTIAVNPTGLNADLLDGQHGAFYQNAGNLNAGNILVARFNDGTGANANTFWSGDGTWKQPVLPDLEFDINGNYVLGGTWTFQSNIILSIQTGILVGNAASPITSVTSSTVGQILRVTGANTYAFGALDLADADARTGILPVANGGIGVATITGLIQGNGVGAVTAITNSSIVGQVLRVTGANTYAWGALNLADTDAITGRLTFANISQAAALSVLGVTGNATADVAAIPAGVDGNVLRRNGNTLTFGAIDLSLPAAVTGNLSVNNLDSGTGASATTYWSGNGTWTTPAGGGSGTVTSVGITGSDFTITGSPVTLSGNINLTIANDVITFAKMQNIATQRLLGRSTAASGDVEEITLGTNLSFTGTTLNAAGGGGGGSPGGSTTQVQFNNAGVFDGAPSLRFISGGNNILIGGATGTRQVGGDAGAVITFETVYPSGGATVFNIVQNGNDDGTNTFGIGFAKTRGIVVGSNTIVQNNDILGIIKFAGANGSTLNSLGAAIEARVDAVPSSSSMPGRFVISTTPVGATVVTERLRITSSGSWGLAGANFGTTGQVITSSGPGAPVSWESSGSIVGGTSVAYKSVNTARNNNTISADPHLSLLLPTGLYAITAYVVAQCSNATPNLILRLSNTNVPAATYYSTVIANPNSLGTAGIGTQSVGTTITVDLSAGGFQGVTLLSTLEVTSPTNIAINWAQQVTDAGNATTLFKGSWLQAVKLN